MVLRLMVKATQDEPKRTLRTKPMAANHCQSMINSHAEAATRVVSSGPPILTR